MNADQQTLYQEVVEARERFLTSLCSVIDMEALKRRLDERTAHALARGDDTLLKEELLTVDLAAYPRDFAEHVAEFESSIGARITRGLRTAGIHPAVAEPDSVLAMWDARVDVPDGPVVANGRRRTSERVRQYIRELNNVYELELSRCHGHCDALEAEHGLRGLRGIRGLEGTRGRRDGWVGDRIPDADHRHVLTWSLHWYATNVTALPEAVAAARRLSDDADAACDAVTDIVHDLLRTHIFRGSASVFMMTVEAAEHEKRRMAAEGPGAVCRAPLLQPAWLRWCHNRAAPAPHNGEVDREICVLQEVPQCVEQWDADVAEQYNKH